MEGVLLVLLFSCGIMIGALNAIPIPEDRELLSEAKQVIKECESTIPRNQSCQLKAVVKGEKE